VSPEPGALDVIATADLAGICRGRSVPAGSADAVGWVPANLGITAFGDLADNPFGALGDLYIRADPGSFVPMPSAGAEVTLALGDLRHADGTAWACCPRNLLRSTLAQLKAETGLTVSAAFEHEFVLSDGDPSEHPFSVQALLVAEPFGTQLVAALTRAGLDPENWLPEFGRQQWEITIRPAERLAAADRAILLREITRSTARLAGRSACFAPTPPGSGAMNGAHIHFSLWTGDGEPATTYGDGGLSKVALSFAAGIIDHAAARSWPSPRPASCPTSGWGLGTGVPTVPDSAPPIARRCCAFPGWPLGRNRLTLSSGRRTPPRIRGWLRAPWSGPGWTG
jgi:glutamine synthetase